MRNSWGPRIELFSRGTRKGWTTWDNQADDSYTPDWATYGYNTTIQLTAPAEAL